MKPFTYRMRVPFYDVDSMRVVYHGNYIKYFEEARCAYFESLGLGYNDMETSGFLLPVVSLNVKYIRSCTFAQELLIDVVREASDNLIILHYTLRDEQTGQKCCKATTRHAAIDATTKALLFELPACFLERLKAGEAQ